MAGHLAQRPLHAVEAAVGRLADLVGHLGAGSVDPGRQAGGELLKAGLGNTALDAGLGAGQAFVELGEGGFQPAHRRRGALFRLAQAPGEAFDHGVGLFVGVGGRWANGQLGAQPVEFTAQVAEPLIGLGLAVVEVAGHLGERAFHGAHRLDRGWGDGLLLHALQALGHAGMFFSQFADGAFEAGRDGGLLAFGGFQTAQHAGDRLVDAADGQGGALLGRLDAGGEPVERLGGAQHVVTGMFGGLETFVGCGGSRGGACGGQGGRPGCCGFFRGAIVEDHLVQPLAKRHARTAGEILGDLARFRIDSLHAPRRVRRHCESVSQPTLGTLTTDS